jgi:hypothetical protein
LTRAGEIAIASVILEGAPPRARPARRRFFYIGVSLLITAIVLGGFGPSFYDMLVVGTPRPWILHLHGAVYTGWLVLLINQAVLAARGRIALHRRVGSFGIAYGALVLVLGVVVSFVVPALHVTAGEWTMDRAAGFLIVPLGDMVLFGGFFGAAVAYRHRPEIHKRLVVLATVAVMFAAVGRLWFVDATPVLLLVWYLPVVVAMGHDFITMRRVHPVYWIGAAVMAVAFARISFGQSELWRGIGRTMLAPLI